MHKVHKWCQAPIGTQEPPREKLWPNPVSPADSHEKSDKKNRLRWSTTPLFPISFRKMQQEQSPQCI